MKYEFTNDAIILSPLFSKVIFRKEEITGVSTSTDYAPSDGTLIGAFQPTMDAVMLHTKKGNYCFYVGSGDVFIKRVQDLCGSV